MHLWRKFKYHLHATEPRRRVSGARRRAIRVLSDLRRGCEPRPGTTLRILAFIATREETLP